VDVVFEVASERYPLDERAATRMAENLRVKAAHEPGAEGTVGARAVADAIERRLIEDGACMAQILFIAYGPFEPVTNPCFVL